MKIYLASDHAGFELKSQITHWLEENGFDATDLGPAKYDAHDDYPDFIAVVAEEVSKEPVEARGIVIGLSGQGEAIVANKFANVRAGLFYGIPASAPGSTSGGASDPDEIVKLVRQHNDANILSLGARFLSPNQAIHAVEIWLETQFSNEPRHARRLQKISDIEKKIGL
jgi:ribose 5-phosphate isomerase B